MRLILIWICNALALLAVAYLLPGVRVDGLESALFAALVLGLINTLIRPLLILLTLPVTVLSLGLFVLVINGLLFWFAGSVLRGFEVSGFWVGLMGALLYSILSSLFSLFIPKRTISQPPQSGPITIDHDKL
ncbi:MAG: phage holin family protein [Nitrosomonadales bacterium]|nr:phage holin family protein [Nitrosomonadales bacterium]